MKKALVSFSIGFLLLSGCGATQKTSEASQPKLPITEIAIRTTGEAIFLYPEVADEPSERELGLMFRRSIPKVDFGGQLFDSGMWFEFQDDAPRKFWMRNTRIPLDILFIDKNFEIVDIFENVKPCKKDPCETYGPEIPVRYVLEVRAGFVAEKEIEVGNTILPNIEESGSLSSPSVKHDPSTLKFID